MDHTSVLVVMIEASIGLSGFAGIAVALRSQTGRPMRRQDALGLTLLVQNGLFCAAFAGLPFLLESFSLDVKATWLTCSIIALGNYFISGWLWKNRLRNVEFSTKYRNFYYALFVPNIVILVMLGMNIAGFYFDQEFGPYLLSIVWPLMVAGIIFAQLILSPVWHLVLRNERDAATKVSSSTASETENNESEGSEAKDKK